MNKPAAERFGSSTQPQLDLPDSMSLLSLWRILWDRRWLIAAVAVSFAVVGFLLASQGERTYTAQSLLVLEDNNPAITNSLSRGQDIYGNTSQAILVFGSRQVIGRVVDELDLLNDPEFNEFLRNDSSANGSETFVRQSTVLAVQDSIKFVSDPNSTTIRVLATTQHPEKSAELANAVSRAFLQDLLETRLDSMELVAEQLGRRVTELRQNVRENEAALRSFLNSAEGLDLEDLTALSDEAQRIRTRLEGLNQEQVNRQTLLERVQEIATLPYQDQEARISEDSALARMAGTAFGPETVANLQNTLQGQIGRDQRLISGLQVSLDTLDNQVAAGSERQLRFQQLEREVASSTEIYEFSVRRLNELRVQGGVERGGGRIVVGAEVPQLPNGRGRIRTAVLFGILGLVAVVGWVLVREATNQTIRTKTDLRHILSNGRIFAIPRAPKGKMSDAKTWAQRLLLSAEPTDYSVAVRRLSSSLIPNSTTGDHNVILSTSDFVTSGKSLLTLGLARSYTLSGKRAIVLGVDMHDLTLAKQIGQSAPELTLQDVLSDPSTFDDSSLMNSTTGFPILLPARDDGNPADLLNSQNFKALVEFLRSEYDVVLVDAPPLLATADAAIVSNYADRLVLVTAADASTPESVAAALEQLPNGLDDEDVVALYAARAIEDRQLRAPNKKFARL